jgi:xylan 1,4-beta-xylosidase
VATLALAWCGLGGAWCGLGGSATDEPQAKPETADVPVTIRIDTAKTKGEMRPVWRFFGHDEPNYTYMKDGKKLLSQLAALSPATVYVRTHNLLTSGDGTPALKWGSTGAYTEDKEGRPRYDWKIVDRIFDTYLERGIKPYVQIGFMPEALSIKPKPYQHEWEPGKNKPLATGWAYPPKDYDKWAELVYQWVKHCVDKYGRAEVEGWYWEVWNEPNIFYWRGKPEEYHKLYDYSVDAVKRALPSARVGGPESAGAGKFLRDFLEHCLRGKNYATGKQGAPLDFIAFHGKGNPRVVDKHVQMGLANQLQDVNRGFEIIASFPELRKKPIVIGEFDPDGCAACPATLYPQNAYRNGTLYASNTAASFARTYELADKHGVNLEGVLTWAFEFEDQPYFAGFRVLASNGIELPVLNLFRMFGLMGGQRLAVESTGDAGVDTLRQKGVRGKPDVHALASLQDGKLCVLTWNYHDDDVPGPTAAVELSLSGLPGTKGPVLLQHYRIDDRHSNAFTAWKRMGSPQKPTAKQYAELQGAAQLALLTSPEWLRTEGGKRTLRLKLPRQAVSLLVFTWEAKSK